MQVLHISDIGFARIFAISFKNLPEILLIPAAFEISIHYKISKTFFSVVKVNEWALQWKMSFNTEPSKQAQEVIFSSKSKRATHPPLIFSNSNVSQSFSQKHLGVI